MADYINDQSNTLEEVVDMDELSNQEIDIDENPIDLTKDNELTERADKQKVVE